MTKIFISRDKEFHIMRYEAKGHSGYGKQGEDIVCAAVSSLIESAALGVLKYLNLKNTYVKSEKGSFELSISKNMDIENRNKVDAILETMVLGLKEIEKQYPEYVILHEVEV
jgi:uncharacterized protein YsxB (DUF464 family)